MRIDQEAIDKAREKYLRGKKTSVFLREKLANVANLIQANPLYYYHFGPYWWTMKALMRKYLPYTRYHFLGLQDDPIMRKRYNFGSDIDNFFAAMIYQAGRNHHLDPNHLYEDENGEEQHFVSYDADVFPMEDQHRFHLGEE